MSRLYFVDVATTGPDPQHHELWEIGLIARRDTDEQYCWQLPATLANADPRALQARRFYDLLRAATLAGDVTVLQHPRAVGLGRNATDVPATVAAELARMLDRAVLVGLNVGRDAAFLTKFFRSHGQCPTWSHLVNALDLGAGMLRLPPPWTAHGITAALDIPSDYVRRTSLACAGLARDIYDRVLPAGP